jgi:hypothetical protein
MLQGEAHAAVPSLPLCRNVRKNGSGPPFSNGLREPVIPQTQTSAFALPHLRYFRCAAGTPLAGRRRRFPHPPERKLLWEGPDAPLVKPAAQMLRLPKRGEFR